MVIRNSETELSSIARLYQLQPMRTFDDRQPIKLPSVIRSTELDKHAGRLKREVSTVRKVTVSSLVG